MGPGGSVVGRGMHDLSRNEIGESFNRIFGSSHLIGTETGTDVSICLP